MKKTKLLYLFIIAFIVFGSTVAFGAQTFSSSFQKTQGVDNWYFCEFIGNDVKELSWDTTKGRWKTQTVEAYPIFSSDSMVPSPSTDVGLMFVSPIKGMVRLKGTIQMPYSANVKGTVIVSIMNGKKELWSSKLSAPEISYDLTEIPVEEGDKIKFRVNCEVSNANDWTIWWPTVEYLDIDYKPEPDDFLYYQKKNGEMKLLEFDLKKEGYTADDGMGFISKKEVFATSEYALVRQYKVLDNGRHRIYANIKAGDERGGGNVITILRNGKEIWKQLIPAGENGIVDVRALCNKDDLIDIQVEPYRFTGYNHVKWECEVYKFLGTIFCEATTSSGFSNVVYSEATLSSLMNNAECYSWYRDKRFDMNYNSAKKRWESTVGDSGYISDTEAKAGERGEACIEIDAQENGLLRITGDLGITTASDGVLSKIYVNDKIIWSSRVGGERSVRWDEPYDVSYFIHYINTVAEVNAGDKIKFCFGRWRKDLNDISNLNNIKLQYIGGNPISQTTEWKLNNSIVIDTKANKIYNCGVEKGADILVDNGTTYISLVDSKNLFGDTKTADIYNFGGKEYVKLRKTAEGLDKTVVWAADRFAILHDGIPVLYGYPELAEIGIKARGGDLFE